MRSAIGDDKRDKAGKFEHVGSMISIKASDSGDMSQRRIAQRRKSLDVAHWATGMGDSLFIAAAASSPER